MSDNPAPPSAKKPQVLFICAGNTCRSVFPEYIARKKFERIIDASSAGIRPGTVEDANNAIYTLKSLLGVDASQHQLRDVRTVDVVSFELVIAMDNQIASEVRRIFPNLPAERLVKWRIRDPYGDDLAEYQRCAQAVYTKLKKLPMLKRNQ